jgi:hypothetical protein
MLNQYSFDFEIPYVLEDVHSSMSILQLYDYANQCRAVFTGVAPFCHRWDFFAALDATSMLPRDQPSPHICLAETTRNATGDHCKSCKHDDTLTSMTLVCGGTFWNDRVALTDPLGALGESAKAYGTRHGEGTFAEKPAENTTTIEPPMACADDPGGELAAANGVDSCAILLSFSEFGNDYVKDVRNYWGCRLESDDTMVRLIYPETWNNCTCNAWYDFTKTETLDDNMLKAAAAGTPILQPTYPIFMVDTILGGDNDQSQDADSRLKTTDVTHVVKDAGLHSADVCPTYMATASMHAFSPASGRGSSCVRNSTSHSLRGASKNDDLVLHSTRRKLEDSAPSLAQQTPTPDSGTSGTDGPETGCEDDPAGVLAEFGGCAAVLPMGCDFDLSSADPTMPEGSLISLICTASCNILCDGLSTNICDGFDASLKPCCYTPWDGEVCVDEHATTVACEADGATMGGVHTEGVWCPATEVVEDQRPVLANTDVTGIQVPNAEQKDDSMFAQFTIATEIVDVQADLQHFNLACKQAIVLSLEITEPPYLVAIRSIAAGSTVITFSVSTTSNLATISPQDLLNNFVSFGAEQLNVNLQSQNLVYVNGSLAGPMTKAEGIQPFTSAVMMGMCSGNTNILEDVQCGISKTLKANSTTIVGGDVAVCCDWRTDEMCPAGSTLASVPALTSCWSSDATSCLRDNKCDGPIVAYDLGSGTLAPTGGCWSAAPDLVLMDTSNELEAGDSQGFVQESSVGTVLNIITGAGVYIPNINSMLPTGPATQYTIRIELNTNGLHSIGGLNQLINGNNGCHPDDPDWVDATYGNPCISYYAAANESQHAHCDTHVDVNGTNASVACPVACNTTCKPFRNDDRCFTTTIAIDYQPVSMAGQNRTVENSARACQLRCQRTEGCAAFTFQQETIGASAPPHMCMEVNVIIRTGIYGEENTWRVDDGPVFGSYASNNVYTEILCLEPGEHHLNYFDSYGDGWHGGTIEAVGYVDAVEVEGATGVSAFEIPPSPPPPPPSYLCHLQDSINSTGLFDTKPTKFGIGDEVTVNSTHHACITKIGENGSFHVDYKNGGAEVVVEDTYMSKSVTKMTKNCTAGTLTLLSGPRKCSGISASSITLRPDWHSLTISTSPTKFVYLYIDGEDKAIVPLQSWPLEVAIVSDKLSFFHGNRSLMSEDLVPRKLENLHVLVKSIEVFAHQLSDAKIRALDQVTPYAAAHNRFNAPCLGFSFLCTKIPAQSNTTTEFCESINQVCRAEDDLIATIRDRRLYGAVTDIHVPGCDIALLEGKLACDDACAGLAFIEDTNVCSGCMSDGMTFITQENVDSLNPPAVMCDVEPRAVLGYWPLDGNAIDVSGHNLDGSAVSGTWIPGLHGLAFDTGVDGVVVIANHKLVDNILKVLMMAQVWSSLHPLDMHGHVIIMSKYESFACGVQPATSSLQGSFSPGCIDWWGTGASRITASTWTHVGVGVDGSNQKHFINGAFVEQGECIGQLTGAQMGQLVIGGKADEERKQTFFAQRKLVIDDAMLFSTMLTNAEVTTIYQTTYLHPSVESFVAPGEILPSGLIGYWPLDGDCKDHSGRGLDMHPDCATADWDPSSPDGRTGFKMASRWVVGRRGLAIRFNPTRYMTSNMNQNHVLFTSNAMEDGLAKEQVMMLAWIMHDELNGNDDRNMKRIMEKQGSYALGLSCGSDCSGALQARFAPCSGWRWWGHGNVPIQEWTHVAVGVDGTNEKHFINGDLSEEYRCAGDVNNGPETSGAFIIGAGQQVYDKYRGYLGNRQRQYGLVVDEVMLFDACLDGLNTRSVMNFHWQVADKLGVSSEYVASWHRATWYRGSTGCVDCCVECQPGFFDGDRHPNTPCEACATGWYSNDLASTTCATAVSCSTGTTFANKIPHDTSALPTSVQSPNTCVACEPGLADTDSDAATPCERCEVGQYSNRTMATECIMCAQNSYTEPGALLASSCVLCDAIFDHDNIDWVGKCTHTIAYTSFEEPIVVGTKTVQLYYDILVDHNQTHKLDNNMEHNPVAYTKCMLGGAELGFQTFYTHKIGQSVTGSIADTVLVGVIGVGHLAIGGTSSGAKIFAPHGSQYYVMQDTGGFVHVEIERVVLADYGNVQMKCWVHIEATSWEVDDIVKVWAELILKNETKSNLMVLEHTAVGHAEQNEWVEHTKTLDAGIAVAIMAFGLQTNSRSEEAWFDHFQFIGTGPDRSSSLCSRGVCDNGTQRGYVVGSQEVTAVCEVCPEGRFDNDANPGTPCIGCPAGRFSARCKEVCGPGTYSRRKNNTIECEPCSPGTYDADNSSATPCQKCPRGRFSATLTALWCKPACKPGQYDRNKAVGQRMPSTTCPACSVGQVDADSDPATPCTRCTTGQAINITGATECRHCQEGTSTVNLDYEADPNADCELSVRRGGLYFEAFDLEVLDTTKLFAGSSGNHRTCPTSEHDGCCACLSDEGGGEFDGDWDNGECCGHCTAVCPDSTLGSGTSYMNNFPLGGKGCQNTCDEEYIWYREEGGESRGCGQSLIDMDLVPALVRQPELRGKFSYNASVFGEKIPYFLNRTGFFMRWSGAIEVPTEGLYSFRTVSDDGSMLHIDDDVIVDNDGTRCCYQKQGDLSQVGVDTECGGVSSVGNPNFCLPCHGEGEMSDDGSEYSMRYQPQRAAALAKVGSVYLSAGMHKILVTYFTVNSKKYGGVAIHDARYSRRQATDFHAIDFQSSLSDSILAVEWSPTPGAVFQPLEGAALVLDPSEVSSCQCSLCRPGAYDNDKNATTACVACPTGLVSSAGMVECHPPCEVGSFSTRHGRCEKCAVGQYDNDRDPLTPCISCPLGMFSAVTGAVDCGWCPAGKSTTGETLECTTCPQGQYAGPLLPEQLVTNEVTAVACGGATGNGYFDTDTSLCPLDDLHWVREGTNYTCARYRKQMYGSRHRLCLEDTDVVGISASTACPVACEVPCKIVTMKSAQCFDDDNAVAGTGLGHDCSTGLDTLDNYGIGCFQNISSAVDISGDGTFASICSASCNACPINGSWTSTSPSEETNILNNTLHDQGKSDASKSDTMSNMPARHPNLRECQQKLQGSMLTLKQINELIDQNPVMLFGWTQCQCIAVATGRLKQNGVCFTMELWAYRNEAIMSFLQCLYGGDWHSFVFIGQHFVGNGFSMSTVEMDEDKLTGLLTRASADTNCAGSDAQPSPFGQAEQETTAGLLLGLAGKVSQAEFLALSEPSAYRSAKCAARERLFSTCDISVDIYVKSHGDEIGWNIFDPGIPGSPSMWTPHVSHNLTDHNNDSDMLNAARNGASFGSEVYRASTFNTASIGCLDDPEGVLAADGILCSEIADEDICFLTFSAIGAPSTFWDLGTINDQCPAACGSCLETPPPYLSSCLNSSCTAPESHGLGSCDDMVFQSRHTCLELTSWECDCTGCTACPELSRRPGSTYPFLPNQDGRPHSHTLELSSDADHVFSFVAAGPNGWHGGYWEILNGCGQAIGGGPNEGVVENRTGKTFVLSGLDICCETCISAGSREHLLFSAGIIDLWYEWLTVHPEAATASNPWQATALLNLPEGTVMTDDRCATLARETPCQLLVLMFELCGTYCSVCQNGARDLAAGTQMCQPCSAGRYDNDNDSTTQCIACPPGKFSNTTGATSCSGVCPMQELAESQICSFQKGSGTGGFNVLVGYTNTSEDCVHLAQNRRRDSNGVTFASDGTSTECYAQIGMSGVDSNPRWQTCRLHTGLKSKEECDYTHSNIGYTSFEEPYVDSQAHFYGLDYKTLELHGSASISANDYIALTDNTTTQSGSATYAIENIAEKFFAVEYQMYTGVISTPDKSVCSDDPDGVLHALGVNCRQLYKNLPVDSCRVDLPLVPTHLSPLFKDMLDNLTFADVCPHTCEVCANVMQLGKQCITIGAATLTLDDRDYRSEREGYSNKTGERSGISVCFYEDHDEDSEPLVSVGLSIAHGI